MDDKLELCVERSIREYQSSIAGLAYLDPECLDAGGISQGQLMRVISFFGKAALIRVGTPDPDDAGSQTIRLDRFQRQSLGVRLGESVSLYPENELPLTRLVLQPAIDMTTASTHHLEAHLHAQMAEEKVPAIEGMILFGHFHHSTSGTTYKVLSTVPESGGVVSPETKVILESPIDGSSEPPSLAVSFDDIGGMAPHLETVREMIQLPLSQPAIYRHIGIRPPRGIIFYGPPGTGKTLLARAIANELHASFYYINGPGIVGSMFGETESNLRKIFGEAMHHSPSVILIDEIDVLAPKRGQTGAHGDTRVVTQLLSLMDGVERVEGVVVVATTNRIHAIDDALRRPGRFDRELFFGPPDSPGREEILAIHTREMPLSPETRKYMSELAELTSGYVGADLQELCREAGMQSLRRTALTAGTWGSRLKVPHDIEIDKSDFEFALERVRPSTARLVMTRSTMRSFSEVGGYAQLKEELKDLIVEPLVNPVLRDEIRQLGLAGTVLHGPSGCGKTLLAAATAREAGANLVVVDGPELFTKWLGQTEEAVRHVFDLARRLSPAMLFFDQIDALAPHRSQDSGSQTTERVISQLLAELDALKEHSTAVTVIAATSRLDMVEPALLRAGRLGNHIHVPAPNASDRFEIIVMELDRLGLELSSKDVEKVREITEATEGKTGADLVEMCRKAKKTQIRERLSAKNPSHSIDNFLDIMKSSVTST